MLYEYTEQNILDYVFFIICVSASFISLDSRKFIVHPKLSHETAGRQYNKWTYLRYCLNLLCCFYSLLLLLCSPVMKCNMSLTETKCYIVHVKTAHSHCSGLLIISFINQWIDRLLLIITATTLLASVSWDTKLHLTHRKSAIKRHYLLNHSDKV
jgi:hypothetical protein